MVKNMKYCGNESTIYEINKRVIGKTHGLSYQFLDNDYNSIQKNGAVCCKDFLQDVVFTETLMQPSLEIYNYEYKYTGILSEQSKLILALDYGITDSQLVDKMSNLQLFLNRFEEKLGFDKTIIITDDDKTIALCHFSKSWIQSPVLLSIYLLLLRYCINYTGDVDIFEYLKNPKDIKSLEQDDRVSFTVKTNRLVIFLQNLKDFLDTLPKFSDLIKYGESKEHNYTLQTPLNYIVHYSGVMAYLQFIKYQE